MRNAGFDLSGTHTGESREFEGELSDAPVRVQRIAVEPSAAGRAAYADFFRQRERPGLLRRAWGFASRLARRHALA